MILSRISEFLRSANLRVSPHLSIHCTLPFHLMKDDGDASNLSHLFQRGVVCLGIFFLIAHIFTHLGTHYFRRRGIQDQAFEQLLGCQEPETRCRFAFSRSTDFNTLSTVGHRRRWRTTVAACLLGGYMGLLLCLLFGGLG